jgi:hypothetical protein
MSRRMNSKCQTEAGQVGKLGDRMYRGMRSVRGERPLIVGLTYTSFDITSVTCYKEYGLVKSMQISHKQISDPINYNNIRIKLTFK